MVDIGSGPYQTQATIGRDDIAFSGRPPARVSLADLMDMRLINYRLRLQLREGDAVISQLGYQTEDFFEQVWLAYASKSRDALFVEGEDFTTVMLFKSSGAPSHFDSMMSMTPPFTSLSSALVMAPCSSVFFSATATQ